MRGRHAFALSLLVAALGAHASEPDLGLRITALAGAPIADAQSGSFRATVEPSLKWKLPSVELRSRVRLRWLAVEGQERADADVRELTASWRGTEASLTLGAQQLNWGRMDILRVTDLLNPVDQNDLFYEELPEAKLALWMANAEWQSGSHTVQLIVTPQVPADRLPESAMGLPVRVAMPGMSPSHTTLAVRYGFEALGWNADFIAVRGWQPMPTLRPAIDSTGARLQGTLLRQDSIGLSADTPIGSTVLRIEGLYAKLKPDDAGTDLGIDAGRRMAMGVGLDVRAGPWFLAGQIIGQEDMDAMAMRTRSAYASAIVHRKWLQDRVSGRALHIREVRTGSSWSSLQAVYELSPNQLVQLQADLFKGETPESFGALRGRSRIAASFRIDF